MGREGVGKKGGKILQLRGSVRDVVARREGVTQEEVALGRGEGKFTGQEQGGKSKTFDGSGGYSGYEEC